MNSTLRSRKKEIDFDKFKMTPWKKFKRNLAKKFNFTEKGGLWVYLPALILYPLIAAIIGFSVYHVGVKTEPRAETDNLKIYSIRRDAALAEDIVEYLDPYATELKATLDVSYKRKVELTVNRSLKIYGHNVYNLSPRWPQSYSVLVTAEPGNIQMISPVAKDMENMSFYTVDYILRNAKVSLAQDYLNDYNYSFKRLPMWLSEGLPCYLVSDVSDIALIKDVIRSSDTPASNIMNMDLLRTKLYSIRTDVYSDSHGRAYAYAFADFFVQKYDEQTVIDWAKDKTFKLEHTGYETYDALYEDFEVFLNENYR